ncbi:unnamed protein product, partial [Onchocerca flexuosa]|uniref:C3H1-type domain-containing protein n=1 Tax=Onchocerca flexuosa TaxID=387005 RepID=A0A183HEY6_9BILA
MSSDQQTTANSSEKKSSAPRYSRGAAPQSARYGYRRFRDTPKKQPKLQKSLAVVGGTPEIQTVEQNAAVSSILKPASNSNVKEKNLAKKGNSDDVSELPLKASKKKVCKYFAAENSCYFGEYCRFLHIQNETNRNDSDPIRSESNLKSARIIVRPNIATISRDDIGKKEQLDIRNSEINYFSRRFRDAKFAYDGSSYFIEFDYKVTDPEWVFEVKAVRLRLKIPEHYPCESIMVTLSESTLPIPLVTYFNKEVKKFLEEKFMEAEKCNTYTGIGKTFIRWLDRNILDFFVDGLRRTKLIIEAEQEGITLHQTTFSNLTNQNENIDVETSNAKALIHDSDEIIQDRKYDEAEIEPTSKTAIVV